MCWTSIYYCSPFLGVLYLVCDYIFPSILLALLLFIASLFSLIKLNWQCTLLIPAVQLGDLLKPPRGLLKSIELTMSRLRGRTHLQSRELLNLLVGLQMNQRLRKMKHRSPMRSSEKCYLRTNVCSRVTNFTL